MNWNRTLGLHFLMTAALAVAVSSPGYAQQNAQQASEIRIQELIRLAAERAGLSQAQQPAGTAQAPAPVAPGAGRPTARLSMDDAVMAALDHNLDLAVQRLNPQLNDIAIASARSVYRPTVTSSLSTNSTTTTPTNTTNTSTSGAQNVTGRSTYNLGLAQSVPWSGGSFNVSFNNNKSTTNQASSLFNPTYNSTWTGVFTQPLLRNRAIDGTRQGLEASQITRDISDVQLRATVTNTIANVRNAYWDFVFAVKSVEVAKNSLALADQLVQNNEVKVQVGTMAPLDVVQARSQAANARTALVAAQATVQTTELALKRLIVSGTDDPIWSSAIDAIDSPDFQAQAVDIPAAVRRALAERTDIQIMKKGLEQNAVTLKYLNNQLLPQADLQATYGLTGVGGTQFKAGSGVNATREIISESAFGGAFGQIFDKTNPQWTVQVNFSYPIGLSTQEAAVARSRVQQNQISAQLKQQELQIATDVTNAGMTVQSNIERVQAAQTARDYAQQQLDAENSKFDVGMSTNYFVVQAQQTFASAQNAYLQAVLNYRKSLVELERQQQTGTTNVSTISR